MSQHSDSSSENDPEPLAKDLWQTAFVYHFILKFNSLFVRHKDSKNKFDFSPWELEAALETQEENDLLKNLICTFAANLIPGRTVPLPWTERTLANVKSLVNAHLMLSRTPTVDPEDWEGMEEKHAQKYDKKHSDGEELVTNKNEWDHQVDSARQSDFYMDGNPFGWNAVTKSGRVRSCEDLFKLPTWEKVQLLRYLCEWQLSEMPALRDFLEQQFTQQDADCLLDEIGRDKEGRVYFAEGEWARIYREGVNYEWHVVCSGLEEMETFALTLLERPPVNGEVLENHLVEREPKAELKQEVLPDAVQEHQEEESEKKEEPEDGPEAEYLLREKILTIILPKMQELDQIRQQVVAKRLYDEEKKREKEAMRLYMRQNPVEYGPRTSRKRVNYKDVWISDESDGDWDEKDNDVEYMDIQEAETGEEDPYRVAFPNVSRSGRTIKPTRVLEEEEPVVLRSSKRQRVGDYGEHIGDESAMTDDLLGDPVEHVSEDVPIVSISVQENSAAVDTPVGLVAEQENQEPSTDDLVA
jgi:hypothetical protein